MRMAISTRITRYVPGPFGSSPMAPAMTTATTPPRIAATTFVTFWIAYWIANSSLRWSGSLCSVRYGAMTTCIAWLPAAHSAAESTMIGSASLAMRPTTASSPTAMPVPKTARRPTRSDAALAGNATRAPASEEIVATMPIVAVGYPSDER